MSTYTVRQASTSFHFRFRLFLWNGIQQVLQLYANQMRSDDQSSRLVEGISVYVSKIIKNGSQCLGCSGHQRWCKTGVQYFWKGHDEATKLLVTYHYLRYNAIQTMSG